jgi:hypothetical protein
MTARLQQRRGKKAGSKVDTSVFNMDEGEGEDKDDEDETALDKELVYSDHFRNVWMDEWVDMFIKVSLYEPAASI